MANLQHAFLTEAALPDTASWQAAIDDCGFELQLDPQFEPRTSVGFVACELHGRDSGFEFYFYNSQESFVSGRDRSPHLDCRVEFRWGSDISECACVMAASYVLAKRFGATVAYEDHPPQELDELLEGTLAVIEMAKHEL